MQIEVSGLSVFRIDSEYVPCYIKLLKFYFI